MNLPQEILTKIINLSYDTNKQEISQNFRKISNQYMGKKTGESLLNEAGEAIAYSMSRMPATYGAVVSAINQAIKTMEFMGKSNELNEIKTLIDVGAGTGAATLAIVEEFAKNGLDIEKIFCLEREQAMISLGKSLLAESRIDVVKDAIWEKFDINQEITNAQISEKENEFKEADIVVSSYMLNEFQEEKVLKIADKLWEMTKEILIIVDPGTPEDYKRIIKIKNYLTSKGAIVIAPCTCDKDCKLPETDWCHFVCRVERTKIQKEAKNASVPYEDEKFTYLILKKGIKEEQIISYNLSRIIRHPVIKGNMIEIKLCSNGQIINKTYTKKDKELYKLAKKAKVGDIII